MVNTERIAEMKLAWVPLDSVFSTEGQQLDDSQTNAFKPYRILSCTLG